MLDYLTQVDGGLLAGISTIIFLTFMFLRGALKIFDRGRRDADADHFERSMEEQNDFVERLNKGHEAGHRENHRPADPVASAGNGPNRVRPFPQDPNDRANRRKSR